ncbi:hypothetical protein [Motilibacter aurantiacus]|uniref:hypothetical protein n=1 Tax=Motilibacter aurantiacus TaxID=2714955 RepID=UPI0014081814|nr:hypothetical protein [Motilibacter aurantiacus]NHC45016.1 hypothetical protein [Motilibacter aurantiacus]
MTTLGVRPGLVAVAPPALGWQVGAGSSGGGRVVSTCAADRVQVILHDGQPAGSKVVLRLWGDGRIDISCSAAPSALVVRQGLVAPLPVIGGTSAAEDVLEPGGVIAAFSASFLEALPLESVARFPLVLGDCIDPDALVREWAGELGEDGAGTAVVVARRLPLS